MSSLKLKHQRHLLTKQLLKQIKPGLRLQKLLSKLTEYK
jgi:hypothetical protein